MKRLLLFLSLLFAYVSSASAAPVVVAVAVGVSTGVAAAAVVTTFAAVAIGVAAGAFFLASMPKVPNIDIPSPQKSQNELKQLVRVSRPPKEVCYGDFFKSGALLFAEEQIGDEENEDGLRPEELYLAVTIAAHPVESIDAVFFNDVPIDEFQDVSDVQLHNNDTVVDDYLLQRAPSWQSDMIGKGTTWYRLGLTYDREKYTNGIPTPRFRGRGKRVFDPRNGETYFTSNAILVVMDYMVNYTEGNITYDRFITSGFGSVIDAANLCEEVVVGGDGQSRARYTINGVFTLDEKQDDILSDMLASMGCQLVRVNGKIGFLPAAYYGPATFTIVESDLIGRPSIQPEASYGNAINTVKGTFVDPDQDFSAVDYPDVVDTIALAKDGTVLSLDMNFRFITNADQAQRVADINLNRNIAGGEIQIQTNYKGLYARVGRVVNLDIPSIGLQGEFRVLRQSNHLKEGVSLSLVLDDANIYNDAVGQPYVSPPLTSLSSQFVTPPDSVQFTVKTIGESVQGIITWTTNDPRTTTTEIRVKDSDGNVVLTDTVYGNSYNVNKLVVGNYTAEVRSNNTRGVSSWAAVAFVIGIPPAPSSVDFTTSNWNVIIKPDITGGVASGTLFEFRYLEDSASFISDPPTYDQNDFDLSSELFVGSSYNHGGLFPDRWQHYWVRSVNVYGSSAWIYARTGTTREQDLVTTVVERLKAIEVESQNWSVDQETGYKLFSPASDPYQLPDGTWLNNPDGLAVFNKAVVRGDIFAESLTLLGSIPPEIDNDNVETVTTYRQNTPPTGDIKEGSLWYKTDEDNKVYRWNGAAWQDTTLGRFDGQLDVAENPNLNNGMKITNQTLTVYDASGNLRVKLGRL